MEEPLIKGARLDITDDVLGIMHKFSVNEAFKRRTKSVWLDLGLTT